MNPLQAEIVKLKKNKDVTLLAHYYQRLEIQQIADFIGDSLELSRNAKEKVDSNYIIFAGVDFMAETASILNQEKKILIPNPESCCPMAAFLSAQDVKKYKLQHPNIPVVTYVNSTAAVKAESDICCTSSNAVRIVQKIMDEFNCDTVLFGPDANLADYVEQKLNIKVIKMPENGHCITHALLSIEDIIKIKDLHPNAKLLVHPECTRAVRDAADFVGSTAQMYNHVKQNLAKGDEFIIGTEKGLLDKLAYDFPEKRFYLPNNNMICYNMKKHTLKLIKSVLEHLDDKTYEVKVPKEIAEKAIRPINKMLEYS